MFCVEAPQFSNNKNLVRTRNDKEMTDMGLMINDSYSIYRQKKNLVGYVHWNNVVIYFSTVLRLHQESNPKFNMVRSGISRNIKII